MNSGRAATAACGEELQFNDFNVIPVFQTEEIQYQELILGNSILR